MSTDLLTIEDGQRVRGGAFSYVSASRLNCWLTCPRKWKILYLDGLRCPTTPSLFLGKVCHSGLECVYRHRQLGIELEVADISRRMLDSWAAMVDEERMRFASADEEQALQKQALDLVAAYMQRMPADEPRPRAVEVAAESPLVDPTTGEDLGIPLLGIMDLVLDGPTGATIVDFKTSARSSEPLEIVHEIQMTCYSYLFRRLEQRAEAGLEIRSLIKTKVPKIEFHRYPARSEGHFRRLFCAIRAYLDDLDTGRFVFRPGLHCSMCDFRTECQAWGGT